MKFLLVIQICSVVLQQCAEPIQMNTYNSHYDCATAGFSKRNNCHKRIRC
jgi:hypothetical protein